MNEKRTAMEAYTSRKVKLSVYGLVLAALSAIAMVIFPILNVSGTDIIFGIFNDDSLLCAFVLTLTGLALCEFTGGIIMMAYSTIKIGTPVKEYTRLWQVKSARAVLISGLVGGPIGTGCTLLGVSMCGSTYAGIMFALLPVLSAIGAKIVFKENISARVMVGIVIAVIGVIIAGLAKPEGVENFYLGLFIAFLAPIGFSIEGLISTNGMDVSEPFEVCGLFRMCGGGVIELIIAIIAAGIAGHMEWITTSYATIFSSPVTLIFIFLTACFIAIQYGGCYASYNLCGVAKGGAIVGTTPIWSIPLGYIFAAIGIYEYSVTGFGIIGAIVVVLGATLVVAKPSELFTLRNND